MAALRVILAALSVVLFDSFLLIDAGGTYPDRLNTPEDIYLRFYNGKKFHEYVDIRLANSTNLLKRADFKQSKPIMLYIHGFKETALQESVQVVISAYLEAQPDTNLILLDWSNMAFGSYFANAAPNTKTVASLVAEQIKKMADEQLDTNLIHVVGHSLGGQIAGFIGKSLKEKKIILNRITALDPAFPIFYPRVIMGHIEASDAKFVDIIHTDAGGYGAPVNTGTVDFWPNGGKAKQPGCPRFSPIPLSDDDLCSHWRSWRFWAESVKTPRAFASAPAQSFSEFKRLTKSEKPQGVVYMGVDCDRSITGTYYLTTNACSPYGKGEDGLVYTKTKKK